MNSALKPLSQPGVPQPGGQASPAKANVATANHAVGLPQGAQNSLHHASNNLVGHNLVHHVPNTPQLPPHAAPSMAPVSANMAQMAQNMSHHGNLSHVNPLLAVSPSKAPSTSAPLSLVQDKANASQPLALTRTPEKKEPDSGSQANGTIDSPKPNTNTPAALKPQNPESNKEKTDISKTSPSTTKPPEKPSSAPSNAPSVPQKSEASNPAGQADGPTQPKVATANEAPEKSPSKPTELKPAQTADVAPTQSDNKPVPESANDSQDKPPAPPKQEPSSTESAKVETAPKVEEKAEPKDSKEPKVEKPVEETKEELKQENVEAPKQEEVEKPQKVEEKVEEKKAEPKPVKSEIKVTPKSTLKLATVTPPLRKRRQVSDKSDGVTPSKKTTDDSTPDARIKRNRTKVQLYQSPTPEIAMATKLSASAGRSTPTKQNDDKLIVFYKNEYLAVRNAEGGFYVCQTTQNVYRTTRKIKIRWLSQDKADSTGETYKPDFYDITDMECVLTTLSVARAGAGGAQRLCPGERARATSILQRALRAERGENAANAPVTEEHPDGLDLSLYTDESQLEKKSRKRQSVRASPKSKEDAKEAVKESPSPSKKAKVSPRRARGAPPAPASKTATAVTEKAKPKSPSKRTPTKAAAKEIPALTPRKGRRAGKESKPSPAAPTPTPSTSTGKSTRTPRKPPAKK